MLSDNLIYLFGVFQRPEQAVCFGPMKEPYRVNSVENHPKPH